MLWCQICLFYHFGKSSTAVIGGEETRMQFNILENVQKCSEMFKGRSRWAGGSGSGHLTSDSSEPPSRWIVGNSARRDLSEGSHVQLFLVSDGKIQATSLIQTQGALSTHPQEKQCGPNTSEGKQFEMPAGFPHSSLRTTFKMWPKETFAQICAYATRRLTWKMENSDIAKLRRNAKTVLQMHHRWFWIVRICGQNVAWEFMHVAGKKCAPAREYMSKRWELSSTWFEKKNALTWRWGSFSLLSFAHSSPQIRR